MTAPSIRFVLFDMDGVLCRYDLDARLAALAAVSGKTPEAIRAAIWDSGFEAASDAGGYPTAAGYLAAFGERLGFPISAAHWVAARGAAMTPLPDVLAFASRVARRCPTAILTNNGPMAKAHFAGLFPAAHGIFGERMHCSSEFGTKKPDPEVYLRLLRRLGHEPRHSFFIDDKPRNIEGARLAGLHAHCFVSYAGLEQEAQRLGLLQEP